MPLESPSFDPGPNRLRTFLMLFDSELGTFAESDAADLQFIYEIASHNSEVFVLVSLLRHYRRSVLFYKSGKPMTATINDTAEGVLRQAANDLPGPKNS